VWAVLLCSLHRITAFSPSRAVRALARACGRCLITIFVSLHHLVRFVARLHRPSRRASWRSVGWNRVLALLRGRTTPRACLLDSPLARARRPSRAMNLSKTDAQQGHSWVPQTNRTNGRKAGLPNPGIRCAVKTKPQSLSGETIMLANRFACLSQSFAAIIPYRMTRYTASRHPSLPRHPIKPLRPLQLYPHVCGFD